MAPTKLFWDWGTAYDLFISLEVLHNPAAFGVRGAWAAGVRARLPPAERETLEQGQSFWSPPFQWAYSLPQPKDGAAALWTLEQLPPAERLPALVCCPDKLPEKAQAILQEVTARGRWDEGDREALQAAYAQAYEGGEGHKPPSAEKLTKTLEQWAEAEMWGERIMEALRTYYQVFFAEEERRIRPALRAALARAQELAEKMPLLDLLEELTQGLRFDEWPTAPELVLAPSYWSTPLTYFGTVDEGREILLFGARPSDASLVPGETVPDALLRALKALSDPTRLRILHYLTEEPLSPAQLSRRLRLRAPTVTHHLKTLRLAGLVQLTLGNGKEDRRYAARRDAVRAAFDALQGFLGSGDVEGLDDDQEKEYDH
jgi:DNA-binding transcriptional ArsR family regulator